MLVLEMERVEVDHCNRCGGTWLDAPELELIAGSRTDADRLSRALASGADGGKTLRRCPRCFRKLREVAVWDAARIALDRCPAGHGLWCDRGEMQALMRSLELGSDRTIAFLTRLYENEAKMHQSGQTNQANEGES